MRSIEVEFCVVVANGNSLENEKSDLTCRFRVSDVQNSRMLTRRGLTVAYKIAEASIDISSTPKALQQTQHQAIISSKFSLRNHLYALQSEIDYKKDWLKDTQLEKPTLPGFEILTRGAKVTLTRKHGNAIVKIVFNVNHSVEVSTPLLHEYQDVDKPPKSTPSEPELEFQIIKDEMKLVFALDLVKDEDGGYAFWLYDAYLAHVRDTIRPKQVQHDIKHGLYDLYERYLEEHGINKELLKKIVEFATYHHTQKHIQLLENVKKFVEN